MTGELVGKSRDEIARRLSKKRHGELVDIIFSLVELEQHLTDREIAARLRVGPQKVRELMRRGEIAPAHKRGRTNAWTAPISAVLRYDARTAVTRPVAATAQPVG